MIRITIRQLILMLATLVTGFSSNCQNISDFSFLDPVLSNDERIEDLISRLTLEEKISQLVDESKEVSRLNFPQYGWWNEALHGVARTGRATVFPQAIGLAATFDVNLVRQISSAIGDEGRAKYNIAKANNNRGRFAGLTYWSPNVNIYRDPRWGRGQETYGEDPFLTSRIGVAFVEGLQGNDPKYLKAAACAKHYVVHSGPEALRHEFNAHVSNKDLWETYMPAFKALVTEAKVEGVMGAYNRTNGEACCASPYLITEVLRNQWGFDGYFVSDCGAIQDIYEGHKLAKSVEEASAMALKSGTNLNCGYSYNSLGKAIEQGLLMEEDIDKALAQLLKTRFRLGLFDPDEDNPYSKIGPDVVGCEKHVKLAREAAQKSIVLVKNNNDVLPLKKDIKTLYVTGPQAANANALIGNYFGVSGNTVNMLDGIASKVSVGTSINYAMGQPPYQERINPIDWTTPAAAAADACIAVLGITNIWEGEEGEAIVSATKGDLVDCRLPKVQIDFLRKIKEAGSKQLIVVITGGSPIIIPELMELADAIIYAFYPGEQGGNAVADIIFGDVSPSGRMPFTVPKTVDDLPPYDDYSMEGRTYRYMTNEPLIPFGFGLSYSTIVYNEISTLKTTSGITVKVTVTNNSSKNVEEVAQVYIQSPLSGMGQPLYSLKDFSRVNLTPGETKEIEFELTKEKFELINDDGERFIAKGEYKIYVGGSTPSKRSIELGASKPVADGISSMIINK